MEPMEIEFPKRQLVVELSANNSYVTMALIFFQNHAFSAFHTNLQQHSYRKQ